MRRPHIASLLAIAAISLPLLSGTTTAVAASPRTTPRIGTQIAELKGSDTVAADEFGSSVAISGTTLVVGAENHARAGRAYVFTKAATGWKQAAELKGSDTVAGDLFGSVAISGTTLVVGAEDHALAGRAYVFTKAAGVWKQVAELKGSDTVAADSFGSSVAISGTTLVVGAENHARAGRAYVFTKAAGVWKQTAELKGSDTVAGDGFGSSVAISGATVVVGAENHAHLAGRAYVFTKAAGVWKQTAELKGSDTVAGDWFGDSVAISGTSAIVGASCHVGKAGRAYVFMKAGAAWKQVDELKGPGVAGDDFGWSVGISGTTAIVGAPYYVGKAGRAYVFTKAAGVWKQTAGLKGSDTVSGNVFGFVAISGTIAVVGAPLYGNSVGRAYVFEV
jgi:hypothetical protein